MLNNIILFKFKTANGRTFGVSIDTSTKTLGTLSVYLPQSKRIDFIYSDNTLYVTHDSETYSLEVTDKQLFTAIKKETEGYLVKLNMRKNHFDINLDIDMITPFDIFTNILENSNDIVKCLFKYMNTNLIYEVLSSGYIFTNFFDSKTLNIINTPGNKYTINKNNMETSIEGNKMVRCKIGKSFVLFRIDSGNNTIQYASIMVIDNITFTFYPVNDKVDQVKMVYKDFIYYDTPKRLTKIIEKITKVDIQPKLVDKIKESFGGRIIEAFISHGIQGPIIIKRIPNMHMDKNGIMKFIDMLVLYEPRKITKNIDIKYFGNSKGDVTVSIILDIKTLDDVSGAAQYNDTYFITKKNLDTYFVTGKKLIQKGMRNSIFVLPKCSEKALLEPIMKRKVKFK